MGAIAGFVQHGGRAVDRKTLLGMADRIAHRGPAGCETWTDGPVAFAHLRNRLEPAVAAHGQPIASVDGRYRMICAGRVYNWRELGIELVRKLGGEPPVGCLHTLLGCYLHEGVEGLARWNGDFACAIWDAAEQSLTLARDHFGMKPLYYALTPTMLVFASEIKSVLAHPAITPAPDSTGIAEFLSVNRFLLLTGNTCYEGVRKLLPASWLRFTADGHDSGRFWNIDPGRRDRFADDRQRVETVREIMVDAIRIRLPEGERVGAALSGGFDSSSIVCVLRHLLRETARDGVRLDTFSYNFGSDEVDETHLVDLVARETGAHHHALSVLQPGFFDDLDAVIAANDGPVVESTALLLYKKMRRVREAGQDVLFSGIAGDELFQGELNYFADLLRKGRLGTLLREVRGVYPVDPITGRQTRLLTLLRAFALSPLRPHWLQRMRGTQNGVPYPPDWLAPDLLRRAALPAGLPDPPRPRFDDVFDQSCWDLFYYELAGASAHYHDCAAAPFAIDVRCPLLDVRLVEAMFATPREWKIREGRARAMQKQAMQPFLPREILEDHVKKDHHPTVTAFMQQALRPQVEQLLAGRDQLSREYVDWSSLERHARPFFAGKRYNPLPIWLAMALERWLQMAFNGGSRR